MPLKEMIPVGAPLTSNPGITSVSGPPGEQVQCVINVADNYFRSLDINLLTVRPAGI